MPRRPKSPCKHPGCPNLTDNRYCKIHTDDRPSAADRGYDSKWRKARGRFLNANPLCVKCKENGRLVAATVVDHIIPHRGERELFWNQSNWQALCKRCHDKKTRTKDQYPEYKY